MTPRPLTDAQLAAGLRAYLPVAHASLDQRIVAEITTTPQQQRLWSILGRLTDADPMARRRMILLVALVALALTVSVAAIAGALLREQRTPDLLLVPPVELPAFVSSTPDASPRSPTPDVGEVVHGWPHTAHNGPGVFSWDGYSCAGAYCVIGFMHNGYGSGDVEIRIDAEPEGRITDDRATAVAVAGYDGIYQRIDDRHEVWYADIEGTTIAIHLAARPRASRADLADAHGIIESMRTELRDNGIGFRLVFTLTTNDWDSG